MCMHFPIVAWEMVLIKFWLFLHFATVHAYMCELSKGSVVLQYSLAAINTDNGRACGACSRPRSIYIRLSQKHNISYIHILYCMWCALMPVTTI